MTSTKYIGMDVHKESISIAVMNFGACSSSGLELLSTIIYVGRESGDLVFCMIDSVQTQA